MVMVTAPLKLRPYGTIEIRLLLLYLPERERVGSPLNKWLTSRATFNKVNYRKQIARQHSWPTV